MLRFAQQFSADVHLCRFSAAHPFMSSPPAPTAEKRQLSADEEKNDEVSKRVRLDSEADSSQPAPRCELCSRQSELNEFWLSKREELEGPSAWQFRNVHREMEERQQPLRPIRRSHLREAQVVYVHEECAGNVRLSFHSLKGPRSEWEQLSRIKNWVSGIQRHHSSKAVLINRSLCSLVLSGLCVLLSEVQLWHWLHIQG